MKPKTISQYVSDLIHTSVEDMQSTLQCAERNAALDLKILTRALQECNRSGYKTKAVIIKRYINRASRQVVSHG